MIEILTNVLPIGFGYIMKIFSMNQKAKQDAQKMQMEAITGRREETNQIRQQMNNESPMAALNRRIIILTILALVVFTQVAPVFMDINTVIPVVEKSSGFLGFGGGETTTFLPVEGLVKYEEIFQWASLIIEVYFGSQLAK